MRASSCPVRVPYGGVQIPHEGSYILCVGSCTHSFQGDNPCIPPARRPQNRRCMSLFPPCNVVPPHACVTFFHRFFVPRYTIFHPEAYRNIGREEVSFLHDFYIYQLFHYPAHPKLYPPKSFSKNHIFTPLFSSRFRHESESPSLSPQELQKCCADGRDEERCPSPVIHRSLIK